MRANKHVSRYLWITAATAALAVPAAVLGQPAAPALAAASAVKGPVVKVQVATLNGKVSAIDPTRRLVQVTGDDGVIATLFAGPDIRNFENLKIGDELTARYTDAYSLALAKGDSRSGEKKLGELRVKVEAEAAKQAGAGAKPGLSAMERTTEVVNVFDIDRERGILTLRGTSGVPVRVRVPDKQILSQIGLNDQLVIGYRHAAMVSFQPGIAAFTSRAASAARGASAVAR